MKRERRIIAVAGRHTSLPCVPRVTQRRNLEYRKPLLTWTPQQQTIPGVITRKGKPVA